MPMSSRRAIYWNPSARSWVSQSPHRDSNAIANFHRNLEHYAPTELHSLDAVAKELGVKSVMLKDETSRFGLPSFKILGASWAIHLAIAQLAGLSPHATVGDLSVAAKELSVKLVAATDGNHGRAVARMASSLGLSITKIFVPKSLDNLARTFIAEEGAEVIIVDGDYDDAVRAAALQAKQDGGLLIQDMAFEDYTEIPSWIVDGYSTLMVEIDEQLPEHADVVVCPVGVGSLAHAVVSHSKMKGRSTSVLAVEPDTAACLYNSLRAGKPNTTKTSHTIQTGMNCGTVSLSAWPILEAGVDVSTTVSDFEVHEAVQYLQSVGVEAGPCGASPLAALKYVSRADPKCLNLNKDSVVVLICSEGSRDYQVPRIVSEDDPVALTQNLVRIDSSNPSLSSSKGAGEKEIAEYIAAWLQHRDIEVHWIEELPGRPSIVGVVRGNGKGKSLMFNGHIDTVTNVGYEGDPLGGDIVEGAIQGRGSLDMKAGIAASMVALVRAKQARLAGDVILAAVADEENLSIGTEQILKAGWKADGAVVAEPTLHQVVLSHKGFLWLEVDVLGVAAHGSLPAEGVDAISKAGHFLVELDKHSQELMKGREYPGLGTGTIHAGTIKGGEEPSSYPAKCTMTIERRTVPGETNEVVEAQLKSILESLASTVPNFKYNLRSVFSRSPFHCSEEDPLIATALKSIGGVMGQPIIASMPAWTDCALLSNAGIPAMLFGSKGAGLHGKQEYVSVESTQMVTDALTHIALDFCK